MTQYVMLGAGLDTFAYRNPFPQLRVFEVDFPATQEWKRALSPKPPSASPLTSPSSHSTSSTRLSPRAWRAQASTPASPLFSAGSALFPISLSQHSAQRSTPSPASRRHGRQLRLWRLARIVSLMQRMAFHALARRVAKAGEPFRLFFTPEELDAEFVRAGFNRSRAIGGARTQRTLFRQRADGLKLPTPGLGRLATAWI